MYFMNRVTTQAPKVSVLMPAYNAEKYIGEAIESILSQTFTDFEFIIVDDGSTDRTWENVTAYAKKDIRIVPMQNERNSQICITLNNGLSVAKGKYVVRIDSDDTSPKDRIEKQVAFMDAHPEVVVSGGTVQICDASLTPTNLRQYNLTDDAIRAKLFRYSPFAHPSVIYSLDAVKKAGMYNPDLNDAEDYDLYFRLGRIGKFANLSDVIHNLRLSSGSISQTRGKRQERLTLYIRLKAVIEYQYSMKVSDDVYFVLQVVSMYIIPYKFKFWLFNKLRG
jgi:glycosyltransferase involved in cell wall biosynthesis